jgi:hypothetical protein
MNAELLIELAIVLTSNLDAINRLLLTAHGQGRSVSDAEIDGLLQGYDAARQGALDAIARKRSGV